MSETRGTYTPADADAIANAMAAGDTSVSGLVGANIRALRVSCKTLATQLHKEQQARADAETTLRDEIAALHSELETQRRMIAQLLRERATA